MDGRRVDGDPVTGAHQMIAAVARLEDGVLADVANHKDAAGQSKGLLHDAVCKNRKIAQRFTKMSISIAQHKVKQKKLIFSA